MKKTACVLCALALLCAACPGLGQGAEDPETIVTIITAPEQTHAERPPASRIRRSSLSPCRRGRTWPWGSPWFPANTRMSTWTGT